MRGTLHCLISRQTNHPQQVMPNVWAASSIASNVHRASSRRRALRRLLSSLQGEGMKVLKVIALAAAHAVDRLEKAWPLRPATLRISAIVELAIGCVLLTVPAVVIQGLTGSRSDQAGWVVGRVLGGALLALGVAGMFTPSQSPERGVASGFAVYNALTTVILVVAGTTGAADGWLLWPVVGLHGILAAALVLGSLSVGRTS